MKLEDFPADWTNLAICGLLVLVFVGWGVHSWLQKRPGAQELEERRRALLQAVGKVGDGTISELQDSIVFYSYEVRGVEYLASQDLSALQARLPADQWGAVGPVSVKYDPRNPANSMVVAEQWSGLRNSPMKIEKG